MFSAIRLLIATAALAVTAGCTTPVKPDPPPRVVEVQIVKYVPIATELTEHVPLAMPQENTCVEAVRVARERRAAVEQCNRQLDGIQATQPQGDEK